MFDSSAGRLLNAPHSDDGFSVYENGTYRWLSHQGVAHSAMRLDKAYIPVLPSHLNMLTSLLFNPAPRRILIIGLGGGELLRFFKHSVKDIDIDVVEISSKIVELFKQYFSPQNIRSIDGVLSRLYQEDICTLDLPEMTNRYDMIYLDVYGDSLLPPCLYQPMFFQRLKSWLTPVGILNANFLVQDKQSALSVLVPMREQFSSNTLYLEVSGCLNVIALGLKPEDKATNISELYERADILSQKFEIDFSVLIDNLKKINPLYDNGLFI
ncbi:MAG: hypothetical protein HUJ30_03200 [Gammaproteobacteria bacterium]|nr:hypothetical protein [Gammaproteobacteria bacterium]